MTDEKRKSFTFQETDLDWINPLLIEWVKENEGKKQGDLIKQLLRDFKSEKKEDKVQVKPEKPKIRGEIDYVSRISDTLREALKQLKTKAQEIQSRLTKEYRQLVERISKLEARKRAGEVFENFSKKLASSGRDLSTKIKKEYEKLIGNTKRISSKISKRE
ncbi:MAG: hypothetical protein JSV18_04620 [Candidatus Bathyarchaeota archaeon]|nr:MAG: hypothetical protein JSV18_04620 [Candidatus Bathyarchaeota archaeon]